MEGCKLLASFLGLNKPMSQMLGLVAQLRYVAGAAWLQHHHANCQHYEPTYPESMRVLWPKEVEVYSVPALRDP